MIKDVSVEQVLGMPGIVMVDVRSEGEFEEGTIPGAVNVQLFNNEERAVVGTEYRTKSPHSARQIGLDIVSPKLPDIIREIEKAAAPGKKVALFCWRGGMRSQSVAYVLDLMGFDVLRISGGYKAYRRHVVSYFSSGLTQKAVVIHGLTGVGKTIILDILSKAGLPVLDLEGIALHRGSVFGKVGLGPSPSQKNFEAQIFMALKKAEKRGLFIVECESRRLGRLLVPESVMNAMKTGYNILVYAPLEIRVRRLVEEYTRGGNPEDSILQLKGAVNVLVKYLGNKKANMLNELIDKGRLETVAEILLKEYYDPLYKYPDGPDNRYDLCVDATETEPASEIIRKFVTGLEEYNGPVNGGLPCGNREHSEKCSGRKGNIAGNC
ncbi:MAG: tRNA 2-selenouridine(34) synthase MnmH [Bacillota bacterium]